MKSRVKRLAMLFVVANSIILLPGIAQPRFFQKHSTWYEKITANHSLNPNSANYVNDILINGSLLTVNHNSWSVTVWHAKENTPYVKVDTGTNRKPAQYGWDTVPIPPEATPPGGADGHMTVISHDGRYAWDFYAARRDSSGKWYSRYLRRWDLATDGINSPFDGKGTVRACPSPHTHGLITYEEIERGYIDHALAFSYWGEKDPLHTGVYPCQAYRSGVSNRPWAMNLGERIQLDPSINIDSLPLNRAGKIIAKALQEYGMIFVMNCSKGCNSVMAESLTNKSISWDGILGSMRAVPLNRLRVLNPIYPSASSNTSSTLKNAGTVSPSAPGNLTLTQ